MLFKFLNLIPDRLKLFSNNNVNQASTSSPASVNLRSSSTRHTPSLSAILDQPSTSTEQNTLSSTSRLHRLQRLQQTSSLPMTVGFMQSSFYHALSLSNQHTEPQLDLSLSNKENIMDVSYRFQPGHTRFLKHQFLVTSKLVNKLTKSSKAIGLTSVPFSLPELFHYSRLGKGMSSLVNETYDKVLVEVLTFYKGEYGRLLILVSMGVSCTVWYLFVPGVAELAPDCDIFPRIDSYKPFFDVNTIKEKLSKQCFIEQNFITEEVINTLENDIPFPEMKIPASGNTRIAVGLGLIIGVFLAMGIVPLTDSVPERL